MENLNLSSSGDRWHWCCVSPTAGSAFIFWWKRLWQQRQLSQCMRQYAAVDSNSSGHIPPDLHLPCKAGLLRQRTTCTVRAVRLWQWHLSTFPRYKTPLLPLYSDLCRQSSASFHSLGAFLFHVFLFTLWNRQGSNITHSSYHFHCCCCFSSVVFNFSFCAQQSAMPTSLNRVLLSISHIRQYLFLSPSFTIDRRIALEEKLCPVKATKLSRMLVTFGLNLSCTSFRSVPLLPRLKHCISSIVVVLFVA